MNYRVRRQGVDLGFSSIEELRQRRASGELTGVEYVQRADMADWQPLDLVLQQGYLVVPPRVPASVSGGGGGVHALIWVVVAVGLVLFLTLAGIGARNGFKTAIQRAQNRPRAHPSAGPAASKPIPASTNNLTEADFRTKAREFHERVWLAGYEQRGQRNPACDAEVVPFLQRWVAHDFRGTGATNKQFLTAESARLAANTNCTDPLVLTVIGINTPGRSAAELILQRALEAFPQAHHQAYPQFYAAIALAGYVSNQIARTATLEAAAVTLLGKCFADGSFTPNDQQGIAEGFVAGWGRDFFARNGTNLCQVVHQAGPDFQWLALVLDAEREMNAAWALRGGPGSTWTTQSLTDYYGHLNSARPLLERAWQMHPDFPMAPCRMMTVEFASNSDINEVRLWFDRTVRVQMDYPGAWSEMRWVLRPGGMGTVNDMLTFGRTALNTGRFDTEVPRNYMETVFDAETELNLAAGHRLLGRADIWPDLSRMYEGYIAAPTALDERPDWRTSYALAAYYAGHYDVSRAQFEALDWQPAADTFASWGSDLSIVPLEVAARTGSLSRQIADAETVSQRHDTAAALEKYAALDTSTTDARTRDFVARRLGGLRGTQTLQSGAWLDFLPLQKEDPNWFISRGDIQRLGNGTLTMASATNGHAVVYRNPVGVNFEVQGTFEVVQPSAKNYFQAGVVLGSPDLETRNWYGFRLRRVAEGDFATFGRGWSKAETSQAVQLNDVTNSFDFIFQNGRVTASVNGVETFHRVEPTMKIYVPGSSYCVGLGAYSPTNSIIRYLNVQLRTLN